MQVGVGFAGYICCVSSVGNVSIHGRLDRYKFCCLVRHMRALLDVPTTFG